MKKREEKAGKSLKGTTRPTLSQLWSFKIRRTRILSFTKLTDRLILGQKNCKRACRTRQRRKSHQIRKFLKFSTFLLLFPAAQEAKEKMHLDFIFFFVISFFVFHLIFHRSSFIFWRLPAGNYRSQCTSIQCTVSLEQQIWCHHEFIVKLPKSIWHKDADEYGLRILYFRQSKISLYKYTKYRKKYL